MRNHISDADILILKYLEKFFFFVECENGYFGTNCSSQCPYNSYGKACQMFCNCPKAYCNFAEGCQEDDRGTLIDNIICRINDLIIITFYQIFL